MCHTRINFSLALRGYLDKYTAIYFYKNYLYVTMSEKEDDLLDLGKLSNLGFYIRSIMLLIVAIKKSAFCLYKLKFCLQVFADTCHGLVKFII